MQLLDHCNQQQSGLSSPSEGEGAFSTGAEGACVAGEGEHDDEGDTKCTAPGGDGTCTAHSEDVGTGCTIYVCASFQPRKHPLLPDALLCYAPHRTCGGLARGSLQHQPAARSIDHAWQSRRNKHGNMSPASAASTSMAVVAAACCISGLWVTVLGIPPFAPCPRL